MKGKRDLHLGATAQRTATLLTRNPRLFCRVVAGKLRTRRRFPAGSAVRRIGDVLFECASDGESPLFFGSYAPLVTHAMERCLKPGDVFIDVGANVGYISAVAAALVGTRGQVHAFEPAPEHFVRLRRVAELNPKYSIFTNPCAVDDVAAKRTIHITREAGQSSLVPLYKRVDEVVRCEDVQALRLDSYIEQAGIERVALIKIDVEGYELPVLKGLEGYFRRTGHRPPIICEIAPRAYPLLGANLSQLADCMTSFGYAAFDLADGTSSVDVRALNYVDDVLFLAGGSS
ncbi:MAG: FkbM family methyltransferase [Candidatus Acidiferrales bacterium]